MKIYVFYNKSVILQIEEDFIYLIGLAVCPDSIGYTSQVMCILARKFEKQRKYLSGCIFDRIRFH